MIVRPCQDSDLKDVVRVLRENSMEGSVSGEDCFVAADGSNLLGIIRFEYGGEKLYLRPIAVSVEHQNKGVGKLLIETALRLEEELYVISRGEAVSFYQKQGFTTISWKEVYPPFQEECRQCIDFQECAPVPLVSYSLEDERAITGSLFVN